MSQTLRIYMLGPLVVERDGRPLPEASWHSRQERRLLAILLAARGQTVTTDRLAEWLWPAAPHPAATTLRSAVSALRRALEPAGSPRASSRYILTRPGGYAWNTASGVWIDVEEFLALTEPLPAPAEAGLARAIALYRGDFLEDQGEAPWALRERERLRERYLWAVQQLAAARSRAGEYAAALELVQRGLDVAPLHEPLWRELIRAQMLSGDAAGALRSYERYRTALDRELGAMPSPQTQALHAAILRGETLAVQRSLFKDAPSPRPAAPVRTRVGAAPQPGRAARGEGPSAVVPLVGRGREMAQLLSLMEHLASWHGGTVAIVGEAGIGKSRLASEALREAASRGMQTIAVRCSALERDMPFAPLGETIGRLTRTAPDDLLARLPASALAQVAELVPALRDRLPALPVLPPVPPDEHRNRLLDALADLAILLARAAPLVALCDDAQWADEATLALVGRLARRAPRHALLIVLAYRSEELSESPALHALLRALGRDMLLHPLVLGRLEEEEAIALVGLLGRAAPERVRELAGQLAGRAGGNPLFLTVAVQMILDQFGAPSLEAVLPQLEAGAALPDLRGARPIRDLVLGRLERLPPAARDLAEQLAVIGRPVSLDLIEQLAGSEGLAAAQVLLERQLLAEDADGRLDFGHELVRSSIAAALLSPRLRLLHKRAAAALIALHGERPEYAAEIAGHLARAGRGSEAELLRFATAAGEHAMRAFAYRAALAHYDLALSAAAHQGDGAPEEIVRRAFAGRLRTCASLLDWDGITATAARYEQWAATRPALPPTLVAPRTLVLLRALTGDLAGAAELSRQQPAGGGQVPPVLDDVLRRTARILEAPEMAESAARPDWPAALTPSFAVAQPLPGDPARELPALLGDEEAALALFQVGWAALMQGLVRDAEPCLLRAYELSGATGQAAGAVIAALQIAHLHALRGELDATERWLQTSLDTAGQAAEATWASIWPQIHQGFLWLLEDRFDLAEQRFAAMEERLAPLAAFQSHRASVKVGLGLTALGQGRREQARQLLTASVASPQALYGFVYVAALHGLARLAALDGRLDESRRMLLRALEYSRRRQLLPEYVRTAIEIGRIERDFGDPAPALGLLADAAELARECRLAALAAAAAALHQRLTG